MRFLNRIDELALLEERWGGDRAELFVLYGRRRVGKSELLTEFKQGKHGIYFEATSGTTADHLEDFRTRLLEVYSSPLSSVQPFADWESALAATEEACADGRLLVILDEFQFIARGAPEFGTLLNRFWRETGRDLPLMLVIAGSDVSFFETEVMGYDATTYGRRTGSLRLEPFRFEEIRLFLEAWRPEDLIRAYAVFGGMPYYLDAVDPRRSLGANILDVILRPGAMLHDEADFLLSMESRLRAVPTYSAIMRALAAGLTSPNEIAQRVGEDKQLVNSHLRTLGDLGLVGRSHPVTANPERSKTVIYRISDPFLRFWYRFVLPYRSRLHRLDEARRHLDEYVLPRLDAWTSQPAFEEVCQRWLGNEVRASSVGRWWGKVREQTPAGTRSVDREADAVALDADGRVLALGSCKWTRGLLDYAELLKLRRIASEICKHGEEPVHYLFSRSGWSKAVRDEATARPDEVRLVDVPTLFLSG